MKPLFSSIITSLLVAAFSSCNINIDKLSEDLTGVAPADTVNTTKNLEVSDSIANIVMNGSYDVQLIQGDSLQMVFEGRKVYADSAIVKFENNTLTVSSNQDRFARGKYTITLPTISSVKINGAGNIKAENFQQSSTNFNIQTSGASEVDLRSSSFGDVKISGDGASDVEFKSVLARNIFLTINGAGNAELERITADTINVQVSGAGDVKATGRCKDFICNINGAGDIDIDGLQVANKK